MIRSFNTHNLRKQEELTKYWLFTPLQNNQPVSAPVKAAVPGCWQSIPGFERYDGEAVYETTFEAQGNVRILCKGVSHTAEVYVNKQLVAQHYNAYTAFSGVYANMPKGVHALQIKVSNRFSEVSALHVPNDYMTYGGISRGVIVQQVADTYIEWVHCTPHKQDNVWHLDVQVKLNNLTQQAQAVKADIMVCGINHTLQGQFAKGQGQLVLAGSFAVPSAATYTQDSPMLYLVETKLYCNNAPAPIDDLIERVGFREIKVQGNKLLLNGQEVKIKGFCRHEDHPQFACSLPFAAMNYDLDLMKDLGANAVRTSHYPNDELFLDLCDERGVLVWEENHARGLTEEQMRNPNFRKQCHDCIEEMITQHFNHPSIVIWGILNECASETEYGRQCYAEQFSQIKQLDTSRPTSFASCKFFNDICLDLPDIVSYNIYPEWYHNTPAAEYLAKLYNWVQTTQGVGKPFIISEIGAGAMYGYRSPAHVVWSEERQADILQSQVQAVLGFSACTGIFIWQFCDVAVSEEWAMIRPRTMNNKGIVDEYRRPKMAYYTVKQMFEKN